MWEGRLPMVLRRQRKGDKMRWRRLFQGFAVAAVAMLFASACLSEEGGGGGGGGGQEGEGDGQIEIMYGFGGDQSKGFEGAMKQFSDSSGVTIKFTDASQSFDTLIRPRVQGNNPPDIALFPQPGLMLDFARQGKLQDLSGMIDLERVRGALIPGALDTGTVDGKVYGVIASMNVKSLVWYPKKAFEAKGYTVPTTIAELETLTNQIKADGTSPWCVGMESAAATGWVATDWIEDFVLRYGGPEKYDQWVRHEIPFNDPVVVQAAQEFEKLALTEGNVFGGRKGVVSNAFATAMNPMFQDPPRCFLHRQGNFITQKGFITEKVRANLDEEVGVFQLPGTDAASKPLLIGGDLAGAFSNDADTKKAMEYITSPTFAFSNIAASSYLSPYKEFDLSKYEDTTTEEIAKLAYGSTVARFDGSDTMPGAVGAGTFWRGMTAWVSGQKSLDEALKDIEDSWPS
jgi:alpha-glucoside transport system substrate-binding protein